MKKERFRTYTARSNRLISCVWLCTWTGLHGDTEHDYREGFDDGFYMCMLRLALHLAGMDSRQNWGQGSPRVKLGPLWGLEGQRR